MARKNVVISRSKPETKQYMFPWGLIERCLVSGRYYLEVYRSGRRDKIERDVAARILSTFGHGPLIPL